MADRFDDTLEEPKNPALGFFSNLGIPNRDATRLKEIEPPTTQASSAINSAMLAYANQQKIFESMNSKLAILVEFEQKLKSMQAMTEVANQILPDISFPLPPPECFQLDDTLAAFDEALESQHVALSEKLHSSQLVTEALERIHESKAGGMLSAQYQEAALGLSERFAAAVEPLTQITSTFTLPSPTSFAATEMFASQWEGFTDKLEKLASVFSVSNVSTAASIHALEKERAKLKETVKNIDAALFSAPHHGGKGRILFADNDADFIALRKAALEQERAELRAAVKDVDTDLELGCLLRTCIDPPVKDIPEELFLTAVRIQQREKENRQRFQQKLRFIKRKLLALLRAVNVLLKRLIQNASGPPTVGGLASLPSFARIFLCVSKIPDHSSPESATTFAA